MAFVNGTTGNDFIHVAGDGLTAPGGYTDNPGATDGTDVISMLTGDDVVHAGGGDDEIDLNAGDLTGGDTIDGGSGNDVLYLLDTGTSAFTLDTSAFANVSHIEGIIVPPRWRDAGTTLDLTDALVGSSDDSHRLTVYLYNGRTLDYTNIATVDASAVTTADNSVTFIDAPYGLRSGSTFTLIGGAGADVFRFDAGADGAASLTSTTTVNGGTGASLDKLEITYLTPLPTPSIFNNVSHIEILTLADGSPGSVYNSIQLPDALVSSADDDHLLTVIGGSATDQIDASLVTTAGNHVALYGGGGADDFNISPANMNSGDTIDGGSDTSNDTLSFEFAGTLTAGDLANVSHIETVRLSLGTNSIAIPDAMVGSADDGHVLTVVGRQGNDTIDASAVTTAANSVVFDSGGGNDTLIGGAGNDTAIYYGQWDLYSPFETFDGGGGSNTLDMSRTISAIWFGYNDPSGIEAWTKEGPDISQDGTWTPLVDTTNVQNLIGTPYDDVFSGDASDNTYTYTGGFDTFSGGGGTNTLDLSRMTSAVWYGVNDPSGIEAWTKDNSDVSQPGTWRPIVDTSNVQNIIGTAYNDQITGGDSDNVFTYTDVHTLTGGFDTFNGGGGSNTLDLSRMSAAIWYGHNDPSGIEAFTKDNADYNLPGTDRALVDTSNVQNVIGSAYNDQITGDAGANRIAGGGGADLLVGAGGGDTFVYTSTADSTGSSYDTIIGFDSTSDRIDLPGAVTGIDMAISGGSLSSTSIDSDLAAAIGSSQLASHHALLFTPSSGSLAGEHFLIVDANGTAGYQAGQDFVIDLHSGNLASLGTADFV